MPFTDEVAARVLAKAGRHCCICRRFRPVKLQVHHIIEESQGGSHTEDNAIPICVTCHIDVHSNVPFTRRFTADELRQHRDEVYHLVAEGKLVPHEDEEPAYMRIADAREEIFGSVQLSREAAQILIAAADRESGIHMREHLGGCELNAGAFEKSLGFGREKAKYKAAIEELQNQGLVEQTYFEHGGAWELTHEGYLAADTASASVVSGVLCDEAG